MPSTVTHSYFIMDVYDKLPINRKIFLKNEKEKLKVFAQSLDPLNFYTSFNLKKGKSVRNFAYHFHTKKTSEYIITLINYIKYNYYSDNPEVMAFLYGMISHYVLDSTIHPYIYYKTGKFDKKNKSTYKYNSKHHELETIIDKHMIVIRENKAPSKYKHYKYSFNLKEYDNNLKEIINFTFKETYNIKKIDDILLKSIKNMKLVFKVFRYDPYKYKEIIYKFIDFILPNSIPKISFLSYNYKTNKYKNYLNSTHNNWNYPTQKRKKYNYSFIDLYIISLHKTLNIIKEIDAYIYKDKKINLNKILGNLSYSTGVDLSKNQTLKYFEF